MTAKCREDCEAKPIFCATHAKEWLREMLGVNGDDWCRGCGGHGRRSYGSTSTWHGGPGGQIVTSDVCDKCWGTGRRFKKGTDLKRFLREFSALNYEVSALRHENKKLKDEQASKE